MSAWRSIGQMGLRIHATCSGRLVSCAEQIDGDELDARSDLFSLGAVLYQMATGQAAFRGRTFSAVLLANAEDNPPSPILVNPAMPVAFSHLIMRLMAKKRADRPQSVAELLKPCGMEDQLQIQSVAAGAPSADASVDQSNLGMALAELQRILSRVEPAAVLVPPRVARSGVTPCLSDRRLPGVCRTLRRGW